ncbi:coiled-coil domain-containing protein 149-like isoform X1 [Argonauta hians]
MELERLEEKFELLRNEHQACRRKLDSKCEALLILSREMDQCRSERDQFKLMAEQLQERYQTLKRKMAGKGVGGMPFYGGEKPNSKTEGQNIHKLLCDSRDHSKSLQFEVDDMKQKLFDAQGDIKLLREQIARQRVGTTDEGINTRHFPAYEREDLVRQLETQKEKYLQLQRDLQHVLDEKEEQETERDAYKTKYERLNQELNYILKGDERRILDIDALVMENRYLQERLKQMEEEKTMAIATASKYKSILERKKNKGLSKFGQNRNDSLVVSQKQVHHLIEDKRYSVPSIQAMADLRGLSVALLETINDKNLALSHQRKTNKILGNRVAELEKKLRTLEVSGLWNIGNGPHPVLAKIRSEYEEVKSLLPDVTSPENNRAPEKSPEKNASGDSETLEDLITPASTTDNSPVNSEGHTPYKVVSLTDLDLLPTKEILNQQSLEKSDGEISAHSLDLKFLDYDCFLTDTKNDKKPEEGLNEDNLDCEESNKESSNKTIEHNVTDATEMKLWQLVETATSKVSSHRQNTCSPSSSSSSTQDDSNNNTNTTASCESSVVPPSESQDKHAKPDLLEKHTSGLFQDGTNSHNINVQV